MATQSLANQLPGITSLNPSTLDEPNFVSLEPSIVEFLQRENWKSTGRGEWSMNDFISTYTGNHYRILKRTEGDVWDIIGEFCQGGEDGDPTRSEEVFRESFNGLTSFVTAYNRFVEYFNTFYD